MIKKMTVEDIAKILYLKESAHEYKLPCELGEWVQFLIKHVDNEKLLVCGLFEDDKLVSYFVAAEKIIPPLKKSINLIFISNTIIGNKEIKKYIIKWGKSKGAKEVIFKCENADEVKMMMGESLNVIGKWVI